MKYVKKLAVILLALVLVIQPLSRKQSSAAVNEGVSTQTTTTKSISVTLLIDSDGATRCVAYVSGKTGTTKIAGTLTLKKGTTVVKSWNVSANGKVLTVSKTCYLLSKGTYKLVLNVNVTCDGKTENVTGSHTDTY